MDSIEETRTLVVIGAFVIGWAVIGFAVGQSYRNRGIVGAVLGGMLGIIGIGCIFLMDDYRVRCPECDEVIRAGARKCRHCGNEFRPKITRWAGHEPIDGLTHNLD